MKNKKFYKKRKLSLKPLNIIEKIKELSFQAVKGLDAFNGESSIACVYHYTTIDSLISILDSKKMRFTYYKDLNDAMELKFFPEGINAFLEEKNLTIDKNIIDYLYRVIFEINSRTNTYISCFSTDKDSLAMWRMYGDDCCGVTIGFAIDIQQEKRNLFEPTITKVIYGSEYPMSFKELFNFINEERDRILGNSSLEEKRIILNYVGTPLNMLSLVNKHESFKLEKEVRLLLFDGELSAPSSHPQGFNFDAENFFKRTKIVSHSYLEEIQYSNSPSNICLATKTYEKQVTGVELNNFVQKHLREIWIGPRHDNSMVDKVKLLLKMNGFCLDSIKVERHKSSYVG